MEPLDPPIRRYAWGSHTAIADLQGRPAPTAEPEAELWLGAHPGSPALLARTREPLDRVIAADPAGQLGAGVAASYGPRLPYLLKVLAAAEPLSLQAHPDPDQAAMGFAAEEAGGVPRDAPHRTYTDASHKPELLVAIEPFDALCGFRAPERSADALAGLGTSALLPAIAALRRPDPADALRGGVSAVLDLDPAAVDAAVEAARSRPGYDLVTDLAARYPGDPGVVLALLLNRIMLQPGDGAWMPAGNLHAYLRGTGVEIMAASDNVLRGGLTPKHVNVPELLRVLRFEVLADAVVRPVAVAPNVVTWPVPVPDFALFRATVNGDPVELPGDGPRVALCLRGSVTVDDGEAPVTLAGGTAAFAAAGAKPLVATGDGVLFQASVGE